jgi:lipopolysaccharide/colanic/teichoic acid biosynthesis glycosyltransferase
VTVKTVSGAGAAAYARERQLVLPAEISRAADLAMRLLDLAGAVVMLILLAPLLGLVALLIKLDSRGPVIFWQRRLGRDLREFRVAKFRTMRDGAATDVHRAHVERMIREEAEGERDDGPPRPMQKLHEDERVTAVGGFLRRTSLDELPQLWNVVRGEMSLVGPRPPIRYEVDNYPARAYRRFAVRPGLTGLWQVSGRCLTTFDEMIELDIEYIERRSFWLNLKILLLTVPTVIHGDGAE